MSDANSFRFGPELAVSILGAMLGGLLLLHLLRGPLRPEPTQVEVVNSNEPIEVALVEDKATATIRTPPFVDEGSDDSGLWLSPVLQRQLPRLLGLTWADQELAPYLEWLGEPQPGPDDTEYRVFTYPRRGVRLVFTARGRLQRIFLFSRYSGQDFADFPGNFPFGLTPGKLRADVEAVMEQFRARYDAGSNDCYDSNLDKWCLMYNHAGHLMGVNLSPASSAPDFSGFGTSGSLPTPPLPPILDVPLSRLRSAQGQDR